MNADVTVKQLDDVLDGLGDSLTDLNKTLTNLNTAVDRLDGGWTTSRPPWAGSMT